MKRKKRLAGILSMLVLCMILSACSEKKAENSTESSNPVSGNAEEANSNLVAGVLEQNSVEDSSIINYPQAEGKMEEMRKQVEFKAFSSLNTLLLELSAGRVNYVQLPNSVGSYLSANDDTLIVTAVEGALPRRHYHMAARTDDTELCKEINNAIDTLKAEGTLDQLAVDYITSADSTPITNTLLKHEGAETHVVAVTGDLPPLDYVSADGTPAGFNVALLNAISEQCGCNFELVQLDADARLSALESGKVDLIFWIGCYSNEGFEPETNNVCLSTPYFEESACLVGYSEDILEKALSIYQTQNSPASGTFAAPTSEQPSTKTPTASNTPILTMEKAIEVNTAAHLLEKYKTVTYAQLDYIGGNTIHATFYKDESGDICCMEDDFGYTGYRTDYFDFSREKGKSTYTLNVMEDRNVSDYLFMVSDSEFVSQTTDVNGNLLCETQADISQAYADQLSETWPCTIEDKMITTTTFAADDYRVLSIDFRLRRPDGSESMIASGVLLYNEEVTYTDAVQGYMDAKKVTVSVQMQDGSTRAAVIPKGETINWVCDDGYTLYIDKDGKTPLPKPSDPVQSDLTLYCLSVQHGTK